MTKGIMSQRKHQIESLLKKEGSENPILETKLLYDHILNTSPQKNKITKKDDIHLSKHLFLIKSKVPVQRQLGFTEVMGLKFQITKDVLLPGPEIEILLKACLTYLKSPEKIIDLCTGCGVIAIILGKKFRKSQIFATDISKKALSIAKKNALSNKVNNIQFIHGDLFQPILNKKINNVDLIVSNPPYCKTNDIKRLPLQIRNFTPRISIDGGSDGMYFHRKIIKVSKKILKKNGLLILENEMGQSEKIAKLLKTEGYRNEERKKNLRKEYRIIIAKKVL